MSNPSDEFGTGADDAEETEWRTVEQRHYDPESGVDLATVVIEAVAAAEDTDVTNIKSPVLYEVVDIAAAHDALFGATTADVRGVGGGSLTFDYRGFRITVRGDGWVVVATPSEKSSV